MAKLEMVKTEEVAKEMGMESRQVFNAILNGSMPIGAVIKPENENQHYAARILRNRWEKWKEGRL